MTEAQRTQHIVVSPGEIAPPAANYRHAILTVAPQRMLHTSGVVPTRPDGSVPPSLAEQAETVWSNLTAMLADADMARTDVVSVTTYVIPGQDLAVVMGARDHALGGHQAASTLVVVPELAQPAWKMEIALIATA